GGRDAHAQAMEEEVVFASNGGAYEKAFENDLFPAFSAKSGVKKLTYVAGQGPETLAKLRAQKAKPAIDVVWLAGSMGYQAEAEGLIQPLDFAKLPNLADIPKNFVTEKTQVPVTATFMSVLYNTKIFREKGFAAPTSWWDMWDPKFKGHVARSP